MMNSVFLILIAQYITMVFGIMFLSLRIIRFKEGSLLLLLTPMIAVLYAYIGIFTTGFIWLALTMGVYYISKDALRSIFFVSLTMLLLVLSDYTVSFFSPVSYIESEWARTLLTIGVFTVYLYGAKFLKDSLLNDNNLPIFTFIASMTFLIYFIIICVERFAGNSSDMEHTNFYFLLTYGAFSTLFTFATIKVYIEKFKTKSMMNELKHLRYLTEIAQDNHNEIRKFKHDYRNIILSLEYYIKDQDWKGLSDYFYSDLHSSYKEMDAKEDQIKEINNLEIPELKGLILDKFFRSFNYQTRFNIEIPKPISSLPLRKLDIVRILGILLDNAVEAVETQNTGQIRLALFKVRGISYLIVSNSIETIELPLYKLKEKGISSKGPNRGTGLSTLDELVNKYENLTLETTIQNRTFTQMITFIDK